MKKLFVLAGCVALAACTEAEAPVEEAPMEDVAEVAYPGGPGDYSRTNAEGQMQTTTVSADGTFITMVDGETVANGTLTVDGTSACFDAEGDEEPAECWVSKRLNADGSFESTNDAGETYTIMMTPPAAE